MSMDWNADVTAYMSGGHEVACSPQGIENNMDNHIYIILH